MPEQRIVPGAPPPTTPQKAQRKKRRAKNAEDDAPKDPVPQEPLDVPDDDSKPNFTLDLLSKRKRLATKKSHVLFLVSFFAAHFFVRTAAAPMLPPTRKNLTKTRNALSYSVQNTKLSKRNWP